MEDKTLRDEIAMSMAADHIPTVSGQAGMEELSKALGIKPIDDLSNVGKALDWTLRMQAAVRYAYADAMMAQRAKP